MIIGQGDLAAVYREIDQLIPEPKPTGGCYLTTACCQVMGLEDNCRILQNLRKLRDEYIVKQPKGWQLIDLYYQTAPQILSQISRKELKRLFLKAIKPASVMVECRKYQEAYELYQQTVKSLITKYSLPKTAT